MLGYLRSLIAPLAVLVVVAGGMSMNLTSHHLPVTPADTSEEAPAPDEGDAVPDREPAEGEEVDGDEDDEAKEKKPRSTEGCEGSDFKNHGLFVSSAEKGNRSDAAKSPCGKPLHAEEKKDKAPKEKGDDHETDEPDEPEGHDEPEAEEHEADEPDGDAHDPEDDGSDEPDDEDGSEDEGSEEPEPTEPPDDELPI